MTGDRPFLVTDEIMQASIELTVVGALEWRNDEECRLSDKGIEMALEVWFSLPVEKRILIWRLFNLIQEINNKESQ